jgi:hypothetical protein
LFHIFIYSVSQKKNKIFFAPYNQLKYELLLELMIELVFQVLEQSINKLSYNLYFEAIILSVYKLFDLAFKHSIKFNFIPREALTTFRMKC